MPTKKSGLDNVPSTKIPDKITPTGDISVTAAKGDDGFRIIDSYITVDEDGNKTTVVTPTTLELHNKQTFYRTGGHNMKGYTDDRHALASNAPDWLLKIANVAYTVSGGYGIVRLAVARSAFTALAQTEMKAYAHGYTYAARIRARGVQDPVAHNFPYSFDDVILKATPIVQKDGSLLYRQAGSINGKEGLFEIAVNPETKLIIHRTFRK
jgi:hypothetical protein